MKKKFSLSVVFAFVIISLFTFKIDKCSAQWVQRSNGIGINQNVLSFGKLGNYTFVGTHDSGVYRSENYGASWNQTTLNNRTVTSFGTLGTYIFTGISGAGSASGVYLSMDNGENWSQTGLHYSVYSIAVSGPNIIAGTFAQGIYISSNNGTSWTNTGQSNFNSVFSLCANGNIVIAGFKSDGVFISINNGTNWTQTSLNNKDIYSLAVIGNDIYAGAYGYGVYLSTNTGAGWTIVNNGLLNLQIYSMAVNENNIFVGTYNYPIGSGGIYLSKNNGANWVQKNQGFNVVPFTIPVKINALFYSNNYVLTGTYGNGVWSCPYADIIRIQNISTELPASYSLSQNYPNPFNPVTNLKFGISKLGFVSLKIYDLLGKEVVTLVNEKLNPGTQG